MRIFGIHSGESGKIRPGLTAMPVVAALLTALILLWAGAPGLMAQAPTQWVWRAPLPQGNNLNAAAFGNGTFVAVGDDGAILSSTEGTNWSVQSFGSTNTFQAVAFGGGLFVVSGYSLANVYGAIATPVLMTSGDGIDWSPPFVATTNFISALIYSDGQFMGVGDHGEIATSPDGTNWASAVSGTTQSFKALAAGPSGYVVGGTYGTILTSPDGNVWTAQAPISFYDINSICHGTNTYVAVGNAGLVCTSPDGLTWTTRDTPDYFNLGAVIYEDGLFIAAGGPPSVVQTSPDGIHWTTRVSDTTQAILGLVSGNHLVLGVGNVGALETSTNGANWKAQQGGRTTTCTGWSSPRGRTWRWEGLQRQASAL